MRDIRGGGRVKVRIDTIIEHRGNPRGAGHAEAMVIYIDRQGKKHVREVEADVENDTKNALALKIATTALRILNKPCDVDLYLENEYVKSTIKNGWLEEWQQRGWKKATGKEPANADLWKEFYLSMKLHNIRFG
jgi:ribonuclease HI